MTPSSKTVERIKKLLALTTSPEPEEAASARSEAKRLMAKHGLTDADFEEDAIEVIDDQCNDLRLRLARAVGASRRVGTLNNKQGQMAFRGKAAAATSASKLYRSLVAIITANCEIGHNDPGRDVWRLCCWQGFVDVVCDRLLDDEVRSWTQQTAAVKRETPPADLVRPAPEAPVVVSTKEQQAQAIRGFANHFMPDDIQRAVHHLCNEAYEGGKRLGHSAPLEKYERNEVSVDRMLEEKR